MAYDGITDTIDLKAPYSERELTLLRQFCGWLSADIRELWEVEVPCLAESLDRFLDVVSSPT